MSKPTPAVTSRIPGFYRERIEDRLRTMIETGLLSEKSVRHLQSGGELTLDVADRSTEAASLAVPGACGDSDVWLNRWGDWGFAFERAGDWAGQSGWEEVPDWTVLLDPGGRELAQFEQGPGGTYLVTAGPAGTVWNEEPTEGAAGSFLLSLDAQQRTPVPGVADGESVEQARWSPDGSQIAVVTTSDHQSIRIANTATGEIVTRIDGLGPEVFQTRWSRDGRYLLVGHDRDDGGAAGAALVVYDTATAAVAIETPFRELHYFREIRTTQLSALALQFTPVEWGIGLEDGWGPGVYTVRMSAKAAPLLPDQIEGIGGRLIWDTTVVELCNIGIDDVRGNFVQIGDIFQTVEGCGTNPNAMQEAFDELGMPELACLVVATGGVDHEYCAPLN